MHGAVRVGARRRSADRSCCRFGANSLFVSTRWQIAPRINSQLNDAEGRALEEERMRDEMKQKFRYGCTGLRGSGRVRVCARCEYRADSHSHSQVLARGCWGLCGLCSARRPGCSCVRACGWFGYHVGAVRVYIVRSSQ